MANDRITLIEQRLDHVHEEIQRRAEGRDKEQADLWDTASDHDARLTSLKERLDSLAAVKPPSLISVWSAVVATVVVVGSLAGGYLSLSVAPLHKDVQRVEDQLRHQQADYTGALKVIGDRQDDVRQRLSTLEGSRPYVDGWIKDMDQNGPRLPGCEK